MTDRISTYRGIKQAGQVNLGADIQQSVEGRRKIFVSKVLDLSTARDQYSPDPVDFNFRTFWVVSATDSTAEVFLVPNARAEGQLNGPISCKQNLSVRLPFPSSGGQLYWSAQSGKTMTILFFIDGEVTPGSLISQISGGVTISDGSSFSEAQLGSAGSASSVTVTTAATMVLKQDSTRLCATLQFSNDVYLVSSGGSAGTGIFVPAGTPAVIRNTAAIYAITAAGTATCTGVVEK